MRRQRYPPVIARKERSGNIDSAKEARERVGQAAGVTFLGLRCLRIELNKETRPHPSVAISLGRLLPKRVVRSPVTFLVDTLRWPPVRCAAGLDFRGAVPREDRHLVSSGGLFARRHMLHTSAEADFGETRTHQRTRPRWGRRTPRPRPLSEGRPLLAVSGSSWRPTRCVVACFLDCVWSLAVAGAQGTGAVCARLSPPVPGPRGGRGHT